jgi:transcriptional antiterminator RfaH
MQYRESTWEQDFQAFVPVPAPLPNVSRELSAQEFPWFAIRVRSNFEQATSAGLDGKGYKPFVPTYRVRRRSAGRVRQSDQPLFPGYVFCRFNMKKRLPILVTPGVVSILGFGGDPVPIPDHEIANIQTIVRSGLLAQPWPFLKLNQKVYMKHGPLAGMEGVVVQIKNDLRLVVSVSMLQRSVAVEIDRDWVCSTT